MISPKQTLEQVLDKVTPKHGKQENLEKALHSSMKHISFPQRLDYSFPTSAPESAVSQIGQVSYIGDGVVHVTGLDNATIDEILMIKAESGFQKALVLGVQDNRIEGVVLGDYAKIKRGDPAKLTGQKMRVPVGKKLLGRVIDALGNPIDGLGPIQSNEYRDVEFPAPGVVDRVPISDPLPSGILAIDTTIPIGRGQRELVIGDRKTGKSRTMLDYISNQKGKDVHCIYVGVGTQAAKAKAALELLTKRGAMTYTTMVIALSDEPPSLQYIAPYVGAALAEFYMYQGKHALIVYDDLSKQAKAYRQVSLLLKRSPGRDAYPGDIFFLHSRLLERASTLTQSLGGGSMTAMPIAETQLGDISDYIITNLMSITDGHIYLDANMMHEGILPAINSGASVSRIGGKVQSKLLQTVGELAGRILARYNEVKSFETINTEVTPETMRDIKRGKRIKEMLSQDSDLCLSLDEQIIYLGIAVTARMDHFDPTHIKLYKKHFVPWLRKQDMSIHTAKFPKSKKVEEVAPTFDHLFDTFCSQFALPMTPTGATA